MSLMIAVFVVALGLPAFAQAPVAAPAPTGDQSSVAAPASTPAPASAASAAPAVPAQVAAPSAPAAAPSSADLAAQSAPAAEQAAAALPSASDAWTARWNFIQAAAKNNDYTGTEPEMVADLDALVSQNPGNPAAPDALFLAASLEQREGIYDQALADLLHLLYEFPGADVSLQAQSSFQTLAKKRLPSRLRPAIAIIAQAPTGGDASTRLAALIDLLVRDFGQDLYGPTQAEIRGFMARFPNYARMDAVQWDLVLLHEAAGNDRAALLSLQEFLTIYPQSELTSKARFKLGALYADLKLYEKAVGAYQAFTADYPQSPENVSALSQIASIFVDHLGQYDMAIKTDEMIVNQTSQGGPAAQALYQEAEIYDCRVLFFSCKLDNPAQALLTYQRLVNTGNLDFLDKKLEERVRSRINSLTKQAAKAQAAAPAAAAPASSSSSGDQ